jgi:hypothetical protein
MPLAGLGEIDLDQRNMGHVDNELRDAVTWGCRNLT